MVGYTLLRIYHDRRSVTRDRISRYADSCGGRGAAGVLTGSARQLIPDNFAQIVGSYPQITAPVLIIWGRDDPVIRLQYGLRLNRDIPGSRLVVIDECGHNPHEEKPEATYAAIAVFLDRILETPH
jgi:pimeloyl-ACP methyl ester carboxylesterase